jgi:hypothetical protein
MSSSPSQQEQTDDAGPILEESGLTEEQRRQIRREQRELLKELNEQDNLELHEARSRNNEIYKNVRYTREAVLDGENLTLIANKAAQQVDRLIQVRTVLYCFRCFVFLTAFIYVYVLTTTTLFFFAYSLLLGPSLRRRSPREQVGRKMPQRLARRECLF